MAEFAQPEPVNIVKEFRIGNTLVRISDDFCRDKTPEDVERILARIAANVQDSLAAAELRRTQK